MIGLKYISFIRETSGFSRAALQYLRGLLHAGAPFTWQPLVPDPANPYMLNAVPFEGRGLGLGELDESVNRPIDYDTVLLHLLPDMYPPWIEREAGKKIAGYLAWETDRLPAHWVSILDRLDLVLVPSRWNKAVLEGSGVATPVAVVPHVLQTWDGPVEPWPEADGLCVFYTIGAWTHRKGLGLTLESYLDAFTTADPVILVIKTGRQDLTQFAGRRFIGRIRRAFGTTARAVRRLRRRYPRPARVLLETADLNEAALFGLHRRGDCFVSLTRGEGWGLAAFEAAGEGNPVVMTGHGGQLDFLLPEDAYLVDYKLVPVRAGEFERSYTTEQSWAEPDREDAGRKMKVVFEDRKAAREKGQRLRKFVREGFSERAITQRLVAALERMN